MSALIARPLPLCDGCQRPVYPWNNPCNTRPFSPRSDTMSPAIPKAGAMTAGAFRGLRDNGYCDFTPRLDPPHNSRNARCRVCRTHLAPGKGIGYDEYMSDGYRFVRRYVCEDCESASRPGASA